MPPKAKIFNYAGSLDREGRILAEGADPLAPPDSWKPEHLLLGAAAWCALNSLRFYARNMNVEASATYAGTVTLRDDASFGFVELNVDLDVTIDPPPEPDQLPSLLGLAEGACFIGNSLDPKASYRWTVNGAVVEATASD